MPVSNHLLILFLSASMFLLLRYSTAAVILENSLVSPFSILFIVTDLLNLALPVLFKNSAFLVEIKSTNSDKLRLVFSAPSIKVSVILKKFK